MTPFDFEYEHLALAMSGVLDELRRAPADSHARWAALVDLGLMAARLAGHLSKASSGQPAAQFKAAEDAIEGALMFLRLSPVEPELHS